MPAPAKASYFVVRGGGGEVTHLVRVWDAPDALWGEALVDGRWVESNAAMAFILNGGEGEALSEAEALRLVEALRGDAAASPDGARPSQ